MQCNKKNLGLLFDQLADEDKKTLFLFAQFIVSNTESVDDVKEALPEITLIERPEKESVINAIKRLSASYHMVDRDSLMNTTSDLMMQHMLKGKKAPDVIDELEMAFEEKYQKLKQEHESES